MECVCLTFYRFSLLPFTSVWRISFVSLCVNMCWNATCLYVTVCVLWEEFMLFAVNTAHNGALKLEPLKAWANGMLRLPQMIKPLCPQGQTTSILKTRKNAIDPDSPKYNQINSFFPSFSYESVPVFWSIQPKDSRKKCLNRLKNGSFLLAYVRTCVSEKSGSPVSLLLNVRSSLWEEFIFLHFHKHSGTLCINPTLLSGETQCVGVRGKFQLKLWRCWNNIQLFGLGSRWDAETQTHINMSNAQLTHKFTTC